MGDLGKELQAMVMFYEHRIVIYCDGDVEMKYIRH